MAAVERTVPHNFEAEMSLLGAMMLSREAIGVAVETCAADDFYRPAHSNIFSTITELYAQGEPCDPVTIGDEMVRSGTLESAGGLTALLDMQGSTPTTSNAARYAKIVAEHAVLRRLIGVGAEIVDLGYSHPGDVVAAVDVAESLVFNVADRRSADTTNVLHELLDDFVDHLEVLYGRDATITGIPTGYVDLDEMLLGLQKSTFTIIGARPSMGKTSFAVGLASYAAVETHTPTLVFSLEMSPRELTAKMMASESRVDATRLRNGRLQESDWTKISHTLGRLGEAPLYVDDNAEVTLMDIRAKTRRVQSRLGGKLGLIVIDYLQLMSGRRNAENRQVEISEISRGLKVLSREMDVPVVALCQLNRSLESRADKRPMLADLRESGSLEQDADVVLFLYRDEVYNTESPDRGTAEVIVAKHRNGPTGVVRLAWLDKYTRFANMARGI